MTIEAVQTEVELLVTQTTTLLDSVTSLKTGVAAEIATAVEVSESATQIPLVSMATDMINTQALVVQLIERQT